MKHAAFTISVHTEASGNAAATPDCLGRGGRGPILSSKSWESGQKEHMPCKSPHVIIRAYAGGAGAQVKWGTARSQSRVRAGGAGGWVDSRSQHLCAAVSRSQPLEGEQAAGGAVLAPVPARLGLGLLLSAASLLSNLLLTDCATTTSPPCWLPRALEHSSRHSVWGSPFP